MCVSVTALAVFRAFSSFSLHCFLLLYLRCVRFFPLSPPVHNNANCEFRESVRRHLINASPYFRSICSTAIEKKGKCLLFRVCAIVVDSIRLVLATEMEHTHTQYEQSSYQMQAESGKRATGCMIPSAAPQWETYEGKKSRHSHTSKKPKFSF